MALVIAVRALASRAARVAATSGSRGGVRRMSTRRTASTPPGPGGAISRIMSGFNRLGNSILGKLKEFFGSLLAQFNFTNIWKLTQGGASFLFSFNWNTTDAELEEKVKQAEIQLSGAMGALAGGTLGWVLCGAIPSAGIAVFNQALGAYLLKQVGEEAMEELAGYAANLIGATARLAMAKAFGWLYKNYRHVLRPAAIGVANKLADLGILNKEVVAKATKNTKEPWSFASLLDDSIDEIKDPKVKEYWEEFYDELFDACSEAGYVVAGGLDSFFAANNLANSGSGGRMRGVRLVFNRSTVLTAATGGGGAVPG